MKHKCPNEGSPCMCTGACMGKSTEEPLTWDEGFDASKMQEPMIVKKIDLEPCPLCGSGAYMTVHNPHTHVIATFMPDSDGRITIECSACSCSVIFDGADVKTAQSH